MRQIINMTAFLFASSLVIGCEALPEGSVTPDGYRPPEPTHEKIENMVRNAIKRMIFIEGGSYMMGNVVCYSNKKDQLVRKFHIQHIFCRDEEKPLHKVTLDSFSLNKYEISFYEYDLFTQATHRPFIKARYLNPEWWRSRDRTMEDVIERFSGKRTGELPASVDWFQASDYCRWLGAVTGLPIELPTEAEWEYAARNKGEDRPYATNDGSVISGVNFPPRNIQKQQPVNSFDASPLGLYHMNFNVQEWVQDWFDESYYQYSPEHNPQGPAWGTKKILRGGVAGGDPEFKHNFMRATEAIDYTHNKKILEMFEFDEGDALFNHGARCAIHLTKPIDIENLTIDLSKPAPNSRAEWLAAKDSRTVENEHTQ